MTAPPPSPEDFPAPQPPAAAAPVFASTEATPPVAGRPRTSIGESLPSAAPSRSGSTTNGEETPSPAPRELLAVLGTVIAADVLLYRAGGPQPAFDRFRDWAYQWY